ncbi:MAG: hypothetical protein AB7R55_13085 [Gemmatimonadales bacterium]
MRRLLSSLALAALAAAPLAAQSHPLVRDARIAYQDLDFGRAIGLANRAMEARLDEADQLLAWQLLGFAQASLDSARQAREAFKQALFLDPDWSLDQERVSPKITSLHALALREVLVVRGPRLDSASFVVGSGGADLRFTVTRTARVEVRLTGAGDAVPIDSLTGEGAMAVRWDGRIGGGPAPAGEYALVIDASSGRDRYSRSVRVAVRASAVDTLAHVTSLAGYDLLSETVVPPRSWRPLGVALITSAVTGGASLALENGALGGGPHRELAGVSVASLGVGILAMLRKPAPVPSEANIRYNRIVRDNIARENERIAAENQRRRALVRLTITPADRSLATEEGR